MTDLLRKAFDQISKLPSAEQDALAERLLAELEDDRRWDEAFEQSQRQLGKLAEKVRRDIADQKVKQVGIDEL